MAFWRSPPSWRLHISYVTGHSIFPSMTMINFTILQQRYLTKPMHHQSTRAYNYLKRGLENAPKTQRTFTPCILYPGKAEQEPRKSNPQAVRPSYMYLTSHRRMRRCCHNCWAVGAMLLLLLPSIVTIFDEICTIVSMLCSLEAERDEPPGSFSPVKSSSIGCYVQN